MNLLIQLFLTTFFIINTFCQTTDKDLIYHSPEWVLTNKPTSLSLIIKKQLNEDVLLRVDKNLSINNVFINNKKILTKFDYENISDNFTNTILIKKENINIRLTDEAFIQLIIEVTANSEFEGETKLYFAKQIDKTILNENLLTARPIRAIKQKRNKTGIQFKQNTSLTLNKDFYKIKNLSFSFWMNQPQNNNEFLFIFDNNGEELLSIGINDFQLLTSRSKKRIIINESFYLSKNSYTKISVLYDNQEKQMLFFANGKKIFSVRDFREEDYLIKFFNNSKNNFEISELYLFELNNTESVGKLSMLNPLTLTLKLNFNKLINENEIVKFKRENINFVKTQIPEENNEIKIDIINGNTFYIIEGIIKNLNNINYVAVEKSTPKQSYFEIVRYNKNQIFDDGKISFTDNKNEEENVIFYRIKAVNNQGSVSYSDFIKIGNIRKENIVNLSNYPNPFNPTTNIKVELKEDSDVIINIYNVVGTLMKNIYEGSLSKGIHEYMVDGSNWSSGIYFLEVKTEQKSYVRKILLAK